MTYIKVKESKKSIFFSNTNFNSKIIVFSTQGLCNYHDHTWLNNFDLITWHETLFLACKTTQNFYHYWKIDESHDEPKFFNARKKKLLKGNQILINQNNCTNWFTIYIF